MTSMVRGSARLESLDGLRGVAALVVVIHHSFLVVPGLEAAYEQQPTPSELAWLIHTPLHVVWAGGESVWVFFVLSGLVLTRAVMSRSPFDWWAYYPSRILRLYLPVVGAVRLSLFIATAVPRIMSTGFDAWMTIHRDPISVLRLVRDLTLIAGPDPSLNSALWSLQWEVLFSLLLPVFVWVTFHTPAWAQVSAPFWL